VTDIFCFIVNIKPVISHCFSILFVMGEHTSCLRKSPTHLIMLMCGLIITLSICRAQIVSQDFQFVNCLYHIRKMNTAVSNFLFTIKEWLKQTKNILCNVLLVSIESGPVPKMISATKPASLPGLVQTCNIHIHVLNATFFHTVHY
jgi:hypothetical protein